MCTPDRKLMNLVGCVLFKRRYNEDLEGVLLSYCRERLVSKHASLHPYFPYLQVTVRADVVLFRPLVASHLGELDVAGMGLYVAVAPGMLDTSAVVRYDDAHGAPHDDRSSRSRKLACLTLHR